LPASLQPVRSLPRLARLSRLGRRLATPPPRREATELLDRPDLDPAELAANLADIRRFNRFGAGTAAVIRHLPALLAPIPTDRAAVVLDLGTGSGDIPLALAAWGRRHGRPLRLIASDASAPVLAVAARHLAAHPEIELARYDARAVPLPDRSVDVVLCSLTLHHFPPAEAATILTEIDRLARYGFVLNDLRRGRAGYAAAWLSSHLATRNRLTRHDAPLSVLRAYTPAELEALLTRAGVGGAVVARRPLFRMTATRGLRTEDSGLSDEGTA